MSRIDVIGQNGNDGIHYDKPPCFLSSVTEQEKKALKCSSCIYQQECLNEFGKYSVSD